MICWRRFADLKGERNELQPFRHYLWQHLSQSHLSMPIRQPIFLDPSWLDLAVGAIMGDVQTGFSVGVIVELMFLAVIFVGTQVPPNPTISTAIATAIAILSGGGVEITVATALPVSFAGIRLRR